MVHMVAVVGQVMSDGVPQRPYFIEAFPLHYSSTRLMYLTVSKLKMACAMTLELYYLANSPFATNRFYE
jgi:hypothetical protein